MNENKFRFDNNKKLQDAMINVKLCSSSVIQNNSLEGNMQNVTKDESKPVGQHELSCPVLNQKTSAKSQPRRKKSSSTQKCVSYQQVDETKDGHAVDQEEKVKKRVSFDEVFSDSEDQHSSTSSGYHSGTKQAHFK